MSTRPALEPAGYLDAVRVRVEDVVGGDRLCGVWLFGSAALGDFAPDRSDLDVQAVSALRLPSADRERLGAALSHESLPCPARGLEFVLYARGDLDDPAGPAFGLNLNSGARMEPRMDLHPDPNERFWFVIDLAIGREHGRPLAGPAPADVFPQPPPDLILASLRQALDWFVANDATGVGAVFGACRAWAWAHDGRWRSKAESAEWARTRMTDPGPVGKAVRLRDGSREHPLSEPEVAAVVDRARAALGD